MFRAARERERERTWEGALGGVEFVTAAGCSMALYVNICALIGRTKIIERKKV